MGLWWLRIGSAILATEISPEKQDVSAPHQAPQSGFQCWEEKYPQLLAVKSAETVAERDKRQLELPTFLFKGPIHGLTC